MREYETTYVLHPALTDADVKTSMEKVSAIIDRHSGYIFRSQNMGKKTLAYRIDKQSKGIYIYLDYSGDNGTVSEIEHTFKLDERVMRYLTVQLSDSVNVEARKQKLKEEDEALARAMAAAAMPQPESGRATASKGEWEAENV